jgi:hypothetical protein
VEKTLADIEQDIAALRANASKYRRLAEERMAADQDQRRIAATLIEVVAELERRAEDLERFVKSNAAAC